MMRPLTVDDIIFDDEPEITFIPDKKFISKPKTKKDKYSWRSYRKWYIWKDWNWVIISDMDFPYKRSIDKDINHANSTSDDQLGWK
jgi:hypothetical protein